VPPAGVAFNILETRTTTLHLKRNRNGKLASENMALPDEIRTLLSEVNASAEAYSPSRAFAAYQSSSTPRHKLLDAARKLVAALEDPEEEVWRFILQPSAHFCLTSAWQCDIIVPWQKERMGSKELASMSKADQTLVGELCVLFLTREPLGISISK
jgi:hypothetical protein